jgi:secreted trypsin-like serine protease
MRWRDLLFFTLTLACSAGRDVVPVRLQADPGIFGGSLVNSKADLAHYVSIVRSTRHGHYFSCTGTNLDEQFVAVNAHCIEGDIRDVRIMFGADQVTYEVIHQYPELLTRSVAGYAIPPAFQFVNRPAFSPDDIAVIRLDRPAPKGTHFFTLNDTPVSSSIFPRLSVMGYGFESAFRSHIDPGRPYEMNGDLHLNVVNQIVLQKNLPGVFEMDGTHGRGTCFGDSGGPVFYKNSENNALVLTGLTSERVVDNEAYDQCNVDSISIDIASKRRWILDSMARLRISNGN